VIDFVAVEVGTYEIKCAKLCGMGHGRMKAKLIVDE
jgi:heme/copper-type cytochrome/quinol oxidase subunit 2